jgi:hypothetical protein
MDRQLVLSAWRVLSSVTFGTRAATSDVDKVKNSGLPEQRDFDLDDLARNIILRDLRTRKLLKTTRSTINADCEDRRTDESSTCSPGLVQISRTPRGETR